MHAAQHADVSMLKLLLHRGASLADVDTVGHNATDYALRGERPQNAAYLKTLGLPSLHVEKELAWFQKLSARSDEAKRKSLTGQARDKFLATCFQPQTPK